jgi:excisionase family DNA binding protein
MAEEPQDTPREQLVRALAEFARSLEGGVPPPSAPMEPLLSLADAARYLQVSTTTVRNLAVGGSVRSSRVGDRIRFRRAWLDEWIDAGGGEVPASPPASVPSVNPRTPQRVLARSEIGRTVRPARPRPEPKPKPPTFIQRIGDQDLRLLADGARDLYARIYTWHVGVLEPLCGASGHWGSKLERSPTAFMCPACLTALAALPEAELSRFGVTHAYMLRQTFRGGEATKIRAGYHSGDGRRTLCGKKDGPWAMTEREPRAKQCFVCDNRIRWNNRDLDRNHFAPRPHTPLQVLIDAELSEQRLTDLIEHHPGSIDARQVSEPLTERDGWLRAGRWSSQQDIA